tara:strand:- start:156 stop:482 length:327 start_codon:yes stop_codon:yes gene_type:complete
MILYNYIILLSCFILNNTNSFNPFLKLNDNLKKKTIKETSSILPKVDSIANIVLKTNERIINQVLDFDFLNDTQKKFIVLNVINRTRAGDKMGAKILDLYYDFVDKIL